ncbi:MAG: hypothetical protein H6714_09825 [Myxococcales bacterium]|nr:hypothetical protein [Myxococcales bacterium]
MRVRDRLTRQAPGQLGLAFGIEPRLGTKRIESSEAQVELAYDAVNRGDIDLAHRYIARAVHDAPRDPHAQLMAGIVADLRGDKEESRRRWSLYLGLMPDGIL